MGYELELRDRLFLARAYGQSLATIDSMTPLDRDIAWRWLDVERIEREAAANRLRHSKRGR